MTDENPPDMATLSRDVTERYHYDVEFHAKVYQAALAAAEITKVGNGDKEQFDPMLTAAAVALHLSESEGLTGRCMTHPSTLHMDGTSPVVVNVQSTTEELRVLNGQIVRLVPISLRSQAVRRG